MNDGYLPGTTKNNRLAILIFDLFNILEEEDKLLVQQGQSKSIENIYVFPYGELAENLEKTLIERKRKKEENDRKEAILREKLEREMNDIKNLELEQQNQIGKLFKQESERMIKERVRTEFIGSMNPRELAIYKRDQKKIKLKNQRLVDRSTRESTKDSRNLLYSMIQGNAISEIFQEKSDIGNLLILFDFQQLCLIFYYLCSLYFSLYLHNHFNFLIKNSLRMYHFLLCTYRKTSH